MKRSPLRPSLLAAPVLALAGACATPESRVWNLEQLHDGETHHRYLAALESDTSFLLRRQFLGLFQGEGAKLVAENDREKVDDPAGECLANLVDLQERARGDDEPDPRHVEWFARIAVEDPAALSRERALLALAEIGSHLSVGLPARLGADQTPAGPEQLAPVLEELVRSVRGLSEGRKEAETEIAERCAAVRALDLDLAAGRRALRASTELARLASTAGLEPAPLRDLVRHLEALCVRRALAAAIEDGSDLVRAAAVHGVARNGGARAFDVVLYDRLRQEGADAPLRALLEEIAALGLPVPDPASPAPKHTREDWIQSIYSIAIFHRDGEMRVRAMQTLQVVAEPGLRSLREEDWHRWATARREAAKPGLAPAGSSDAARPQSGNGGAVPPP